MTLPCNESGSLLKPLPQVKSHVAPTDITQLLQPLVTPTGGLPLPLAAALHRPEHGLQHLGAEGDARRLLNAELGRADLLLAEDA